MTGHSNTKQAAADAFGNVIGNDMVSRMKPKPYTGLGQAEYDEMNRSLEAAYQTSQDEFAAQFDADYQRFMDQEQRDMHEYWDSRAETRRSVEAFDAENQAAVDRFVQNMKAPEIVLDETPAWDFKAESAKVLAAEAARRQATRQLEIANGPQMKAKDAGPGRSVGSRTTGGAYLGFHEQHPLIAEISGVQSLPGTLDGLRDIAVQTANTVRGYAVDYVDGGEIRTYAAGKDGVKMAIEINNSADGKSPAVTMSYGPQASRMQQVRAAVTSGVKGTPVLSVVGTGLEYEAYKYAGQSEAAQKANLRDFTVDVTLDLNKSIVAGAAAGAVAGSVIPVVGTAIGAVIGLAVGIGTAYLVERAYTSAGSRSYFKGRT